MWERAEDVTPPDVTCSTPPAGWSAANIVVSCTASDYPSDLMTAGDASFTLETTVPADTESSSASTVSRTVCDRRGNCFTVGPFTGLKVDRKAPVVSCATADWAWHATDVALPCTSTEGGSGFAAPADASFSLTTSVPAGTETDSAPTGSRTVCDLVGNCSTAGPVGGVKVDRKAPVIVISSPTATSYLHNSTLTLGYTVTDGGSGVATTVPSLDGAGNVGGHGLASGQAINLLTELTSGSHVFAVHTADAVGNISDASVSFQVIVTAESIRDEVGLFRTDGDITKQGIAQSLLAKLAAAQSSRAAGDCATAANQYAAFVNEVLAQAGKAIDNAVASVLIADAQYLIAHAVTPPARRSPALETAAPAATLAPMPELAGRVADGFAARIRELEENSLGPLAVRSYESRGRERDEAECLVRTPFQRDRDRILHSKPFRLLEGEDAGLHRPRRRPLPHAHDPHPRDDRDCPCRRTSATAE